MSRPSPTIGGAIRTHRTRRGWSQGRLADEAGLHCTEVSRLERDLRQPRLGTVMAIAAALELSLDSLLVSDTPARVRCVTGHSYLLVDSSRAGSLVVREINGAPLVELTIGESGYEAHVSDGVQLAPAA